MWGMPTAECRSSDADVVPIVTRRSGWTRSLVAADYADRPPRIPALVLTRADR